MARLELPVMNTNLRAPAASASSAAYWINGLSTIGNISLGLALVAGRNRVPRPATGKTAVLISFATTHLRRQGWLSSHFVDDISRLRPANMAHEHGFADCAWTRARSLRPGTVYMTAGTCRRFPTGRLLSQ